jgi:hypothetical protein
MGWWRIDPETGKPAERGRSKLSRPPGFVLLNAVPGADDSEEAHYLGDGAWDMVDDTVRQIKELLGERPRPSEEEARRLFWDRTIPPSLSALGRQATRSLLKLVEDMWADLDDCYDWDWNRPPRPAEKKWLCEGAVEGLARAAADDADAGKAFGGGDRS